MEAILLALSPVQVPAGAPGPVTSNFQVDSLA